MSYSIHKGKNVNHKQNVLIVSAPENMKEFNQVKLLMDEFPCVVCHYSDNDVPEISDLNKHVIKAALFVITKELLSKSESLYLPLWNKAREVGIPVIPVRFDDSVLDEFNGSFGNIHVISLKNSSSDECAKDSFLRALSNVLYKDEDIKNLDEELSMKLFLSYRKKDRQYVDALMKMIHRRPELRDVGIWFDGSLTPGEDFNEEIESELFKSSGVLLLVTNHLMEQSNYVHEVEYPKAVGNGIDIYPIGPFDKNFNEDEFLRMYPATRPLIDPLYEGNFADFETRLVPKEDTPKHLYYIGLAYILGISMEQDIERGEKLIVKAAEAGYPMAISRLGRMYLNGYHVRVNEEKGIYWLNKSMEYFVNNPSMFSLPNYSERINEKNLDEKVVAFCKELYAVSEDCLMILRSMESTKNWTNVSNVIKVLNMIIRCQKYETPLFSRNLAIVDYEKIKKEDGTFAVGKGIYKNIYRRTGSVRNPNILDCISILKMNGIAKVKKTS